MKKQIMTFGSVLLMAAFILGISGCKKDDTPSATISKPKTFDGDWEVKSYTVDGEDIMNESYSDVIFCMNGDVIEYSETFSMENYIWSLKTDSTCTLSVDAVTVSLDLNASEIACAPVYETITSPGYSEGSWSLSSDKKYLTIATDGAERAYEVLSLTSTQLKLRFVDQEWSTVYLVTLEK